MSEDRRARLAALLNEFAAAEGKNMSQAALARYLRVSQPSVGAWLSQMTYPDRDSLEKISKGLGKTFEELEAYLENKPLLPRQSVDSVMQEIRVMPKEDFLQVMRVVFDRVEQELHQSLPSSPSKPFK
jgi:transcriptional regulator with XRE-family HTH domain